MNINTFGHRELEQAVVESIQNSAYKRQICNFVSTTKEMFDNLKHVQHKHSEYFVQALAKQRISELNNEVRKNKWGEDVIKVIKNYVRYEAKRKIRIVHRTNKINKTNEKENMRQQLKKQRQGM